MLKCYDLTKNRYNVIRLERWISINFISCVTQCDILKTGSMLIINADSQLRFHAFISVIIPLKIIAPQFWTVKHRLSNNFSPFFHISHYSTFASFASTIAVLQSTVINTLLEYIPNSKMMSICWCLCSHWSWKTKKYPYIRVNALWCEWIFIGHDVHTAHGYRKQCILPEWATLITE